MMKTLRVLGVVGAVSTFLYQHGLHLDATSVSALVATVLAYLQDSPLKPRQ